MSEKDPILLILTPGFPANEADSNCLPAQQQLLMALNLVDPSLKIHILSFQYPYKQGSYQWKGNTVTAIGGRNKKRIHRLYTWLKVWQQMNRISKNNKVSTVFCFWYGECSLIGKLFAKKHRLSFYAWILGQDALPGNKYCKWNKPQPNELLSVSDAVTDQFFRNYHVKPAHLLPNAILPAAFQAAPVEKDIALMGAGSLIPLKQYHLFIEVVGRLKKLIPGIRAVLCGEGECMDELREQISKAGLEQHIILEGALSHSNTLALMHRSKIFLHPSSYEGFSGACLEALYAGAYVISFCQPMHGWIKQWHIVSDTTEMTDLAFMILTSKTTTYQSILPYNMLDNAKKLCSLFS